MYFPGKLTSFMSMLALGISLKAGAHSVPRYSCEGIGGYMGDDHMTKIKANVLVLEGEREGQAIFESMDSEHPSKMTAKISLRGPQEGENLTQWKLDLERDILKPRKLSLHDVDLKEYILSTTIKNPEDGTQREIPGVLLLALDKNTHRAIGGIGSLEMAAFSLSSCSGE